MVGQGGGAEQWSVLGVRLPLQKVKPEASCFNHVFTKNKKKKKKRFPGTFLSLNAGRVVAQTFSGFFLLEQLLFLWVFCWLVWMRTAWIQTASLPQQGKKHQEGCFPLLVPAGWVCFQTSDRSEVCIFSSFQPQIWSSLPLLGAQFGFYLYQWDNFKVRQQRWID